ncbi:MAG: ATP-dependent RecD-like DNA helicase [Bacilli bacterium]
MENFISGTFNRAIYKSESGYYIGLFNVKETNHSDVKTNKILTFTGHFHELKEGDSYIFFGELTNHPKYGEQFNVVKYERVKVKGKDGVIEFLSSDLFPKVGVKMATSIVETLGEKALDLIMENEEALMEVPKMNYEKAMMIRNIILDNELSEKIIVELCDIGFSMKKALVIYNKYKDLTFEIINNNIYDLICEDTNLYFPEIDSIASTLNSDIDTKNENRIKAAFLYSLSEISFIKGDTYCNFEDIIMYLESLLKTYISTDLYDTIEKILCEEGKIILEDKKVFLPSYYEAEKNIAGRLSRLSKDMKNIKSLDNRIDYIEKYLGVNYNIDQKEAIKNAIKFDISIITGGPGTGKTTIIKAIVELLKDINKLNDEQMERKLALLAPTGKASKKMSESLNFTGSTIHRFLKWNKESGKFLINEYNMSDVEYIIIDEFSMIDTLLFDNLLKGLHDKVKIIIVGDVNQLPSVAPGNILFDLIESDIIAVTYLNILYRQSEDSFIPVLAENIRNGELTDEFISKRDDYSFIEMEENSIKNNMEVVCKNAVSKGYDLFDIQVLIPMYKGINGIDNMNKILQDVFNPINTKKREITYNDITYRQGDKILVLNNLPDLGIYNGDMGYIDSIYYKGETSSKKQEIIAIFDGNKITFTNTDFHNFTLGYAISIHKSQGSEFKIIIMPIDTSFRRMLYKKLVYTGITRAKNYLIILGNSQVFKNACLTNEANIRKTNIKEFILNNDY